MTPRNVWLLVVLGLIVLPASCVPPQPKNLVWTIEDYPVTVTIEPGQKITPDAESGILDELKDRAGMLDPAEGDVLGRLNLSDQGEVVPAGRVSETLTKLLQYSRECFGAFDPTVQVLWDVYDFNHGGRRVTDAEIADALQWVDYKLVEMDRGGILRKGENVRVGLGPTMPGAIADWASDLARREGIERGKVNAGQCVKVWGEVDDKSRVYEFRYPLDKRLSDEFQPTVGFVKLDTGESLAALDDDEGYFFAGGEQFHMVLSPLTGKPVRDISAVVIVSKESCLQASVFAYAVMVMGLDRGLEFLDETEGVEGLILTHDGKVHASGGLGDKFWR